MVEPSTPEAAQDQTNVVINIIPDRSQYIDGGKYPRADGKYRLPDRRLLVKSGDKLTLVGHREKKVTRNLAKLDTQILRKLLMTPGFGGCNEEELEATDKDGLIRMLEPRPKQFFSLRWVKTSESPEARELRRLVRRAELD